MILRCRPFSFRRRLLQVLDVQLRHPQDGVPVLALGLPLAPLPPLLLDLDAQGLGLDPQDGGAALKDPLVDVGAALHGVVAAADDAGAVEAEDVAREDAGHAEWEADLVALLDEVGEAMDVDGDVVARLGGEEGQEVLHRVGDGGGGSGRVALLEGQGADLAGRGVGGVVAHGGDGLDDGSGAVERAGGPREWEDGGGRSETGCAEAPELR